MNFKLLFAGYLSLVAVPFSSLGAQQSGESPLVWQGYPLELDGAPERVSINEQDGREVLTITRTGVMLGGVDFAEGVIEFDVAFDDRFGFGGPVWHVSEDGRAEYLYLRKHKSGLPDAGQYTPIRNGLTSWQIYSDRNGIAPFAHTHEGWNRVKLVVQDDRADIFYNGSTQPVLHIPDLAADTGSGGVGFRASGTYGELRISNLVIRGLLPGEGVVGRPADVLPPPAGVIAGWRVSEVFDEALVAGQLELPAAVADLGVLGEVAIEPNGIADISRLTGADDLRDTVLVSARIRSDRAKRVRLAFGYSDRVRLFLNGELVFDGEAGWRTRDFFFLGTIGFSDAVVLDLAAGENVLSAAVSETFGGWGFAGAIADREGIVIEP